MGRSPDWDKRSRGSRTRLAHQLARSVHDGQLDRYGEPVLEHVERVADAVNASAKPVAYVHDICERSLHTPREVAQLVGLDNDERVALELLTKQPGESLIEHTRRIVESDVVVARDLALLVKRADIADHASHAEHGRYDEILALLGSW